MFHLLLWFAVSVVSFAIALVWVKLTINHFENRDK